MDIQDLASHVVRSLQEEADEVTHAVGDMGEERGELHFLTARFGDRFFSVTLRQCHESPASVS